MYQFPQHMKESAFVGISRNLEASEAQVCGEEKEHISEHEQRTEEKTDISFDLAEVEWRSFVREK